jgi:molybdate transport system substrate-binding protein
VRRIGQRIGALLLLALLTSGTGEAAERTLVAVAANFAPVMRPLERLFESATGHELDLSVASSGSLYAQIDNGAPFEVFLSADADRPRRLEGSGAAVAGTRFTYAIGRLALWCPGLEGCSEDESILASDRFRHLAIADPEIAPYGRAARQLLVTRGLWERLRGRLVTGASVAQAHQFVASGAAEVGLVALSQVLTEEPSTSWRSVPARMHSPIEQQAVLLRPGRDRAAALAFLEFLAGTEARGVIRDFGYDTSEP